MFIQKRDTQLHFVRAKHSFVHLWTHTYDHRDHYPVVLLVKGNILLCSSTHTFTTRKSITYFLNRWILTKCMFKLQQCATKWKSFSYAFFKSFTYRKNNPHSHGSMKTTTNTIIYDRPVAGKGTTEIYAFI